MSGVSTPICDFVRAYGEKGFARLHMPGHKGKAFLGCEALDITEIAGADELYRPEGVIAESEENARRLFGFGKTVYGTEGSSQCIRAMLFLAMQAARPAGRPVVLAGRNAHKAFHYACALLDLDVEWLVPEEESTLCTCPVTPMQVQKRLAALPEKPIAVTITAPDYLGYRPDISGLAEACKRAGVPLLVDNAHGAYMKFLSPSAHPIDLGAAMCCDSAHKTLPVLTGGAYLQLSAEWAERIGGQAKKAMELFGSTSPSYLILQSLDLFNRYAAEGYPQKLEKTVELLEHLRDGLRQRGWEVLESDPLRLTLLTAKAGRSGREIAVLLRQNGVECEFADEEAVVLMATPENSPSDFRRVMAALEGVEIRPALPRLHMPAVLPERKMSIRQAVFAEREEIPCEAAAGRICAMPCVSCPPAIPIVAGGEVITAEMLPLFRAYGVEQVDVVKL